MDNNEVPSSTFTECLSSVKVEPGVAVGRIKEDFNLGRLCLIGGLLVIPFFVAKSDFKRHNGNFRAEI